MKHTLIVLVLTLIALPNIMGQTIASTSASTLQFYQGNTGGNNPKFHFCSESKAGFGITAAGILLGCAGIAEYDANNHNSSDYRKNRQANTGAAMWLVGGVVAIMGSILAIDGSVHDMHRFYRQHKFSMSSGYGNEIGLAYNFK